MESSQTRLLTAVDRSKILKNSRWRRCGDVSFMRGKDCERE